MEGERDVPQKSSGADDDVGVTENRGVRIKIDSKVGRGGATAGLTQETAIVLRARSSAQRAHSVPTHDRARQIVEVSRTSRTAFTSPASADIIGC